MGAGVRAGEAKPERKEKPEREENPERDAVDLEARAGQGRTAKLVVKSRTRRLVMKKPPPPAA